MSVVTHYYDDVACKLLWLKWLLVGFLFTTSCNSNTERFAGGGNANSLVDLAKWLVKQLEELYDYSVDEKG